jgi:DNA mismatch repair protein MSH4
VRNYGILVISQTTLTWTAYLFSTVRPEFTGTLAIKAGRHPVLESVQGVDSLVANDAYCSDSSYFQVIQGPKSVACSCVNIRLIHD